MPRSVRRRSRRERSSAVEWQKVEASSRASSARARSSPRSCSTRTTGCAATLRRLERENATLRTQLASDHAMRDLLKKIKQLEKEKSDAPLARSTRPRLHSTRYVARFQRDGRRAREARQRLRRELPAPLDAAPAAGRDAPEGALAAARRRARYGVYLVRRDAADTSSSSPARASTPKKHAQLDRSVARAVDPVVERCLRHRQCPHIAEGAARRHRRATAPPPWCRCTSTTASSA